MALLQLAEGMDYLAEDNNPMKDYIFIPSGMFGVTEDTYVRQDFFDGLDSKEYEAVISSLAPFQNTGLSAFGLVTGAVAKKGIDIAKKLIAQRQERVASGQANPILKGKSGSLIGKVKSAVEKFTKKGTDPEALTKNFPIDIGGSVGGTTFDLTTGQPEQESFFVKYKTPLLIAGGLVVAFIGYKAIKKK